MGVVVVNFLAKNLATVTNGFNYSISLAWGSLRIFWSILLDIKYAQKYTICGLFIWLRLIERRTGKKIVVEQSLRIHKNYQAKVCNLLVRFVPLVIDHNPGYKS